MSKTLHWYILREMGKTFVLSAIGLTLVFALGGGVFNMIRIEGASARQMAQLLGFVLPVATTLTLPVAALFSAAITYGRLSADNEINACRSSGINVHVLFLPALAISIFAAAFTFHFANYVIPGFVKGVDEMVRKDLPKIVAQELNTKGHLRFRNYVIHASKIHPIDADYVAPGTKQFGITNAHVIELDGDDLGRYLTGERSRLTFDEVDGIPRIRFEMWGAHVFDRVRNESIFMKHQGLAPLKIPRTMELKEKWFDLPALMYYRNEPQKLPDVQDRLRRLRFLIVEALEYHAVADALTGPEHVYRFGADGVEGANAAKYELRSAQMRLDRKDKHPVFDRPSLQVRAGDRTERVGADHGYLRVEQPYGKRVPHVRVVFDGNVKRADSRVPDQVLEQDKYESDLVPISREHIAEAGAYTDERLLDWRNELPLSERVADEQVRLGKELEKRVHRIIGIIHSRSAFSASVLLLVPLGAALGTIFRGGHVLTAFGISFAPGLVVTVLIIMGRQLAENTNTSPIGIAVIWGGLAAMALVNVLVLALFVRR